MRVLVVTEYYYPHIGGLEKLFQNLSEGLVKAGCEVTVVTARLAGTEKRELLNGVNIYRVPVPVKGDRYWFTLFAIPAALRFATKADVVLTTTYNGAFPAWLAARVKGLPSAIFTHEVVGRYWGRIGLSPMMARLYRRLEDTVLSLPFDAFICNSDSTMKAFAEWKIEHGKLEHGRAERIYPGIDYSLFNPVRGMATRLEVRERLGVSGDFLYIFFGRPGFVKGVEHLIRAVPLIKKTVPNSKPLLILSRKPREGYRKVEELLKELQFERGEDIIILDPVDESELPSYLGAADCVVVPSLSEGFGFTCVEACSTGTPVVASDVASLPEVISGKYALVTPADPNAIATGVEKVFNKEYTETPLKKFMWEDTVTSHIALFKRLIEDRLYRNS